MCSLEKEDIVEWRAKLINAVIAGEMIKAGIPNPPMAVTPTDENCVIIN